MRSNDGPGASRVYRSAAFESRKVLPSPAPALAHETQASYFSLQGCLNPVLKPPSDLVLNRHSSNSPSCVVDSPSAPQACEVDQVLFNDTLKRLSSSYSALKSLLENVLMEAQDPSLQDQVSIFCSRPLYMTLIHIPHFRT